MVFVEYIRGGGPRYVYGDDLGEKTLKNVQPSVILNQPLMASYKDILPIKKLRRMHLRIIAGIEMFYGNFKRFKFFFAAQEIPEVAEYIQLSNRVKEMQLEEAHKLLERGLGMQAVDELLKEAGKLEQKKRDVAEELSRNKQELLKKYDIKISDLDSL